MVSLDHNAESQHVRTFLSDRRLEGTDWTGRTGWYGLDGTNSTGRTGLDETGRSGREGLDEMGRTGRHPLDHAKLCLTMLACMHASCSGTRDPLNLHNSGYRATPELRIGRLDVKFRALSF